MLEPAIEKLELATESAPQAASSSRTNVTGALARRFIDILLEDAGKAPVAAATPSKSAFALFGDLEIEEDPAPDEEREEITLGVDQAAAAVLLAAAFEEDPAMLKALRREAPVYVMQLPDVRSIDFFKGVLRACVLGRSTGILTTSDMDGLGRSHAQRLDRRHAVMLDCDAEKRDRDRSLLAERAMTALSLAVPIVALSVDVGRMVPESIRAVADRTIVIGGWNAPLLAIMIEAVTGTPTAVPDEDWIAKVTLDDVRMSVSRHRGAEQSLERLRVTVGKRLSRAEDLPPLASLHGYGAAMDLAKEMLIDLEAYRSGEIGWSQVPRGLVLAGPTGTGKTFLVRCFAKASGLPLVIGSMAAWQASGDGHLGDCLSAMKRTFTEARNNAPCVLFIDEIDSIGDRSNFHHRHRDYSSQVVNCLLEELDGASDRSGIVVFAATNHVDRVDPAVLRPGRLEKTVHIEMPDVPALAGILRTQLGSDLPGADLVPIALAGRGGSGADVAAWVRRAKGVARRAGRGLAVADLLDAVREGRIVVPDKEKRRIALHEAAHAAAAISMGLGAVHGVSLHDTGGTTDVRPAVRTTTRTEALSVIVHCLAGRAAERFFLGSVSAGAGGASTSDLALATRTAFAVEASWGLGENGPLWMGDMDADFSGLTLVSGYQGAVRRLLRHCEAEAERLVAANEPAIVRCADRLIDVGYLDELAVLAALGDVVPFEVVTHPVGSGVAKNPS